MALVFYCPHCGGQNFVASERLNHRGRPVVCWICGKAVPWDFLEKAREESEEKPSKSEEKPPKRGGAG